MSPRRFSPVGSKPSCKSLRVFAAIALITVAASAAVQVASPFGDHMVLQQQRPVPVWGTADAGEKVSVEFGGKTKSTVADASGHWRGDLDPQRASAEPADLIVSAVGGSKQSSDVIFQDVLVGEVWLCGGQSNMERQLGLRSGQKPIFNWEHEVAAADHPLIR